MSLRLAGEELFLTWVIIRLADYGILCGDCIFLLKLLQHLNIAFTDPVAFKASLTTLACD